MADLSDQEFALKVEWEGGVVDALDYGLRASDLDDSNPTLKALWLDIEQQWLESFEPAVRALEDALEDVLEADGADQ